MQLLFHDEDGRITQSQSGAMSPDDLDDLRARGFLFVVEPDGVSAVTNYVVGGDISARPVAPITINRTEIPADKRSKIKIAGLPVPCVLQVDGEAITVEDGLLELTADMPATYSIVFDTFPFMPWSTEVKAV